MFESNASERQMPKPFDYKGLALFLADEKGTRLLFDKAALCTAPCLLFLAASKGREINAIHMA